MSECTKPGALLQFCVRFLLESGLASVIGGPTALAAISSMKRERESVAAEENAQEREEGVKSLHLFLEKLTSLHQNS